MLYPKITKDGTRVKRFDELRGFAPIGMLE
jgi:hypothetical protein